MHYKIEATPQFATEAKKLSKKYPSLKKDIALLVSQLSDNPVMGTSLGKNFYKIRLAISSKEKGKSGGARVITCVKIIETLCISQPYMISLKKKILQTKN